MAKKVEPMPLLDACETALAAVRVDINALADANVAATGLAPGVVLEARVLLAEALAGLEAARDNAAACLLML